MACSITFDLFILNNYKLGKRIGTGGCATVYEVTDKSGKQYVAKLEYWGDFPGLFQSPLENERCQYRSLVNCYGVPQVYQFGPQDVYNILITDRLGSSLDRLLQDCKGHFSLRTTLLIADQLQRRLQSIHKRGVVHSDIKPSNCAVGIGRASHLIHLIDFANGRALEEDQDAEEGKRKRDGLGASPLFAGTPEYASLSLHRGDGASAYDDLESLGYMLVSFMKELPWGGIKDHKEVFKLKRDMSVYELCSSLPPAFGLFLEVVRERRPTRVPNYSGLRKLFSDLFRKEGHSYTLRHFDWSSPGEPAAKHTPGINEGMRRIRRGKIRKRP